MEQRPMTDQELADKIRETVREINGLSKEAAGRGIAVNFHCEIFMQPGYGAYDSLTVEVHKRI